MWPLLYCCMGYAQLLYSCLKYYEMRHPVLKLCYIYVCVCVLHFVTNTRMDIEFSVQHLIQFMQSFREPHLKLDYHVLRYLQHDPAVGFFFSNKFDLTVSAYCDCDYASCPNSRKSLSGYLVLMVHIKISWKSMKQPTVSLSSAEAEYRVV